MSLHLTNSQLRFSKCFFVCLGKTVYISSYRHICCLCLSHIIVIIIIQMSGSIGNTHKGKIQIFLGFLKF